MNFGELRFWSIFLTGLLLMLLGRAVVALIRGGALLSRYDKLTLAALGLWMLGAVSRETLAIYLVVVFTTYWGLKWIVRGGHGSVHWLWILVPLQLAPLLYYKYARFILEQVLDRPPEFLADLVIPVGISFYSFQKIAFAVDTLVLRRDLPKFLDYLNFVGFFPQLVAGPIERREDLLPQIERFRFRWLPAGIDEGVSWIALGLFFKCCLADNLATFFDPLAAGGPLTIWKQNVLFGLRIYYDFAGYSLVTVGLGKCLGIDLTLNFLSPYCSQSPAEFWRRWHVTLSQWFRDYVYVPLGGGRVKWWAANVLLVFLVSGIWHGAGWNFVLWGLIHALLLIAQRLMPDVRWPRSLGWATTLFFVILSWLFFYETRSGPLFEKLALIANPLAYSITEAIQAVQSIRDPNTYVCTCFVLLSLITLILEWLSLRRGNQPYVLLRTPVVMACLIVLTVWLAPGKTNDFIYFAF